MSSNSEEQIASRCSQEKTVTDPVSFLFFCFLFVLFSELTNSQQVEGGQKMNEMNVTPGHDPLTIRNLSNHNVRSSTASSSELNLLTILIDQDCNGRRLRSGHCPWTSSHRSASYWPLYRASCWSQRKFFPLSLLLNFLTDCVFPGQFFCSGSSRSCVIQ